MRDASSTRTHGSCNGGLFFGGALILLGAGFLLHRLGQLPGGMSPWHVWPSMVAWAGLLHLFGARRTGEIFWGLLLLAGGTVGQLHYLDVLPFSWSLAWPALLILAGVCIALGGLLGRRRRREITSGPATLDVKLSFGGREERFAGRAFSGGRVQCLLAGYKLDLRDALPDPSEAVLDVDVFMGGIELLVPRDWQIVVEVSPSLGGIEEKQARIVDPPARRLVLRGRVVMGGIEIKN